MNSPTTPREPTEGSPRHTPNPWAQVLEDVALLLHQAALDAWASADQEGITSDLHPLALGVYLAHSNTVALLPAAHEISPDYPLTEPPAQTDPGRLVRSAESRLRAIAPGTAPGSSALVVEVCDLVREFRDHGY